MGLKKFFSKYGYFILFLLISTLGYKLIQIFSGSAHVLKFSFEDKIPFIPVFVIPYLLFFPLVLLPFILNWKNKEKFKKISLSFLITVVVLSVVYVVYPTRVPRFNLIPSNIFVPLKSSTGITLPHFKEKCYSKERK